MGSIVRKTGAANRTEAAGYAHRHALVDQRHEWYDRRAPVYMIERRFDEQLGLSGDAVGRLEDVNADEGVSWLYSFLSTGRHRT